MTLLSIIIPSNRSLKSARASLESALIYADKVDARVIVADNSEDAQKRDHFRNASPRLLYLETAGFDAMRNMMATLSQVETPFVMPMGDDDEIYALERRGRPDLATLPPDVIGVRPITMTWSLERGVHAVSRLPLLSPHADGRIREFSSSSATNNSIYYSLYRTGLFRGLYEQFDRHHPTHGTYCDWALMFCFMACGRLLHDPTTIFRYDLGRWADKQKLEESTLAIYRQAGLPEEAVRYSALLRFIDTHGLMMWKDLPITPDDRQQALALNAKMALPAFVEAVAAGPGHFSAEARAYAEQLKAISDINEAFAMALPVVDRLKPGLADRYVRFLRGVTGLE